MSEELKPCPFCGIDQITQDVDNMVFCQNCGASFFGMRWNDRPIEDALRARCAELEARLDVYNGNMYDVVVAENEKLHIRLEAAEAALETIRIERDYRPRMDDYERLLARAEAAEAANRWIHITEKLPPIGVQVLVWLIDGYVVQVERDATGYVGPEWVYQLMAVSHWRPLEPPEAQP